MKNEDIEAVAVAICSIMLGLISFAAGVWFSR